MDEIRPRTTLKDYPELAQKVGLVVAEYAVLEQLMLLVYAMFSNLTPQESFTTFFELRKSHLRKELILKAAENLDPEYQKALSRLWRRFANAANRRTEIAHATYIQQDGKVFRLQSAGTTSKFTPLIEEYFQRTFTQYHNLGSDLLTFAALLGGSLEKCAQVTRSLPLSPGFDTREWVVDPHPTSQSVLDQTQASLVRLRLAHRIVH